MTLRESHQVGAHPREFFTGRTTLLFNAVSDPMQQSHARTSDCCIVLRIT